MAEDQSTTILNSIEAQLETEEARSSTISFYPTKQRIAVLRPSKTPKKKKSAIRKAPYSIPRSRRARAPSPPDIPGWPTDFCAFMDCDVRVPHSHTTQEIRDKFGWSPSMNELFLSSWGMIDDSEEYGRLRRDGPSHIDNRRASVGNPAADADPERVSIMLHPHGHGTQELREALPNVGHAGEELQVGHQEPFGTQVSAVTTGFEGLDL